MNFGITMIRYPPKSRAGYLEGGVAVIPTMVAVIPRMVAVGGRVIPLGQGS